MSNGENHRKGVSGEGEPLPEAEALVEPAEVRAERDTAAKEPDIPDVFKTVKQEVYRRFGFWGLVALALVGCFGWVWWNWEEVRQRPFVQEVVAWIERDQLAPADSDRFTVAITRLENDLERKYEGLIFESLNETFATEDENAVQILRFDRMIERGGGDLEAAVQKAHQTARVYLDETGADVLIWGAVLGSGEESTPKLYWTPARDVDRARDWGRYETEDLALPEVFWADLADILQLLVVTRDAEFQSLDGHFVADRLRPFVDKVRSLLTGGGPGWAADTRARVQLVLADSLSTLGEQAGLNEPFGEAIDLYRKVLSHNTREKVPLDWAGTQNNLGNALSSLGERSRDAELVCDALGAHLAGSEVFSESGASHYIAGAKNGIKSDLAVLRDIAEPAEYEQCVARHRVALDALFGRQE